VSERDRPEDFEIVIEVRAAPATGAQADFLPGVHKQINRSASVSVTMLASALLKALEEGNPEIAEFVRYAAERVYRSVCSEKP
jgi:hypothetical protein